MDEILQNDPAFIAALMQAVEAGGTVGVQPFARLTGTGEASVRRAWKDGSLPASPPEGIPIREGVIALASLGGCRKKGCPLPAFLVQADARARELLGLPPRDDDPAGVIDAGIVEKLKLKLTNARAEAAKAQAEKLKLETEIKRGDFVRRAEVELDAATTATNVSVALMQMPVRLAGMCAGLSAEEIVPIIRDEVAQIVRAIQIAAFTGDWGNE